MKYAALLLLGFTFCFGRAAAQTAPGGIPWDATYKIPKGEKMTIVGEKGKIIDITNWAMDNYAGNLPIYRLRMAKKETKTGEKVEFTIFAAQYKDGAHLVLKENDELTIEGISSVLAYLSGYIYEVH